VFPPEREKRPQKRLGLPDPKSSVQLIQLLRQSLDLIEDLSFETRVFDLVLAVN
jgi:hypothetical protein